MYALINAIYEDPKTPVHVRKFLLDHVDTATPQGNALFDVLSMIHDFKNSIAIAHYQFDYDGSVFEQLGDKIVSRMCDTEHGEELEQLVLKISEKLAPHKDEHGFVDMGELSWEEASYWLLYGENDNNHTGKNKELLG